MKKYGLKGDYCFRRTKAKWGRWHARDERLANGPAFLPLCARPGKYCYSTERVRKLERICPDCLKLIREHNLLVETAE
jgi:hypothetical protein